GPPSRSGEANVLIQVTTIVPRNPAKQVLPNLVATQPSPGTRRGRPRDTARGLGHSIGHAPEPESQVAHGHLVSWQWLDKSFVAAEEVDGDRPNLWQVESVWPPEVLDAAPGPGGAGRGGDGLDQGARSCRSRRRLLAAPSGHVGGHRGDQDPALQDRL